MCCETPATKMDVANRGFAPILSKCRTRWC